MDRLTLTSIIASAAFLIFLIVSLTWHNDELRPRIWQLNEVLEQDPELAEYPYDFKVLLFLNGVVTLTSPQASDVPLRPFLNRIDPSLADKSADAPEVVEAERRFRAIEMQAIRVMLSQSDVESVVWSLDRAWYHKNRVPLAK
ncbi:hypothetical protein [Allochromatium vinosum]|uniref:Uncharacterized protein n=1 Tax=Allochromatium vinosum (strain ATCC 17899 / DSM 180 / NBRC 103801 / NCIMB 10441 / D) TaxID=572477 RepID=D3RPQ2_ALLVD|nr:hypothetical protein [Allochromatium vinosum]ADC61634.1 hypothetical protein Alvin_0685 [Allochromatium vinosum DSM 180]